MSVSGSRNPNERETTMKFTASIFGMALLAAIGWPSEASARGFGVAARGGFAVGPGGAWAGGSRAGFAAGPYGYRAGGAQARTYVGPRGTTVQAGRAGGVAAGPFGGVRAGGAEGVRVTTPGGRTYASGSRGGVAVGPYGRVAAGGSRGAVAAGPFGAAAVGGRAGIAAGPYGGVAVGGRGAVAVGHATYYASPVALRTSAAYVRTGFAYPYFTPVWYRAHPVAWVAPRWTVANVWVAPAWPAVSVYCGITAPPILYDYGSSVVIENNVVYVNGENTGSAEQYAQQARQFADNGREAKPAENEEWKPLGVFGMIQGEEKVANHIFQLAVNKSGVVRGNYYDAIADNTLPVYGSVDQKTQRVAWSIDKKKDIVFEAGLNNLTREQTTLLVHYGKERTQQMVLVRLEEPDEKK